MVTTHFRPRQRAAPGSTATHRRHIFRPYGLKRVYEGGSSHDLSGLFRPARLGKHLAHGEGSPPLQGIHRARRGDELGAAHQQRRPRRAPDRRRRRHAADQAANRDRAEESRKRRRPRPRGLTVNQSILTTTLPRILPPSTASWAATMSASGNVLPINVVREPVSSACAMPLSAAARSAALSSYT